LVLTRPGLVVDLAGFQFAHLPDGGAVMDSPRGSKQDGGRRSSEHRETALAAEGAQAVLHDAGH
jgi:hypothetical protein